MLVIFLHLMVGPPESMREHVVAASKAMKKGDWRQCRDYILAVKVKLLLKVKHNCLIQNVNEKICLVLQYQ